MIWTDCLPLRYSVMERNTFIANYDTKQTLINAMIEDEMNFARIRKRQLILMEVEATA